MNELLEQIAADQKADLEQAAEWWRETGEASKIRVWEEIQKDVSDPVRSIVLRFAQVGFTHVALMCDGKGK